MNAAGIVAVVVATLLLDWAVSPETRRSLRARLRLRARAARPILEVVDEGQRRRSIEHWRAMAEDARRRMLANAGRWPGYAASAERELEHAERKIAELSRR